MNRCIFCGKIADTLIISGDKLCAECIMEMLSNLNNTVSEHVGSLKGITAERDELLQLNKYFIAECEHGGKKVATLTNHLAVLEGALRLAVREITGHQAQIRALKIERSALLESTKTQAEVIASKGVSDRAALIKKECDRYDKEDTKIRHQRGYGAREPKT